MTLDWRLPDETTYLSQHERLMVRARFHPLSAAYPFIKAALTAFVGLWIWAAYGILGTAVIIAAVVQWLRGRRVFGDLSFVLASAIVVGVLFLTGFAGNVGSLIVLLLVFALGVAVYQLVDFYYTQIFLTDQRIFRVSGLLTRQVATMPLKALTDIRYEQTVLGRLFNYGHFHVESAGQDQALGSLHFVAQPGTFYRLVMAEALGAPQPELSAAPDKPIRDKPTRDKPIRDKPIRDKPIHDKLPTGFDPE